MAFPVTIFLSAFLLFVVQLVLGKFVLPWFGGAPAVWTTCVLFFQIMLLLGYAYAHLISTRLSPTKQAQVHAGLLALSVLVLGLLNWRWGSPILPSESWKPKSPEQPVGQILRLLFVSVGFPFFLLAATSPLLQHWRGMRAASGSPYRLYALSNVGSMLGLLAYPFIIEPLTPLSSQGWAWGVFYACFAAVCATCAVNVIRMAKAEQVHSGTGISPVRIETHGRDARATDPSPRWGVVALWLALAAITSAMFLSVTNNLCQDVAVVPFLWVLPLAIYLLSFILCFANDRWYHRGAFIAVTAIASLILMKTGFQSSPLKLTTQILLHSSFLFCFCMMCHGELVRLKPAPRHLTLFYLAVALGGVIGGVFVGLIAPAVFTGYWEFPLILIAGWITLAIILARERTSMFHRGDRWQFGCLILLVSYPLLDFVLELTPLRNAEFFWRNRLAVTMVTSVFAAALVLAVCWRRPLAQSRHWPRILVVGVVGCSSYFLLERVRRPGTEILDARRNFYGVVRVVRDHASVNGKRSAFLQLRHGQVNHGIQFQDDPLRRQPVGYYSTNSGIELAFRLHPRRITPSPMNVGVLGLGVGTLAAFAREGDEVRFYEINPVVCDYSTGANACFTYVRDCTGRAEVVSGDGRLSLEREGASGQAAAFDILAMDAFSGDSVPIHLLTREAFKIYLARLREPDGIIAVNISNRYLDLRDLMFGVARHFGLAAVVIDSRGNPPDMTASRWCLLSRNAGFVQQEAIQAAAQNYQATRHVLWTDDFSNLFQLLR